MESVDEIIDRHINPSILVSKPINNAMLEGVEFFDPKVLSIRLSRVYHDIFSQHDWIHLGYGRFRHAYKDIIAEVHNKYNILNSTEKSDNLKSLRRLKNQERVYGCIYDKEQRDIDVEGVRLITGDLFLRYMLGDEAESVQVRLKYLIHRFYRNVLKPWLRYKLR